MRWRNRYNYDRPARPKAATLKPGECEQAVAQMKAEIGKSPVLKAFALEVRVQRGRFYLDWRWTPSDAQKSTYGRITPLAGAREFLLETPHGTSWSKAGSAPPSKLMRLIAGDKKGTFHGLGLLDASLRLAEKEGITRFEVSQVKPGEFAYSRTGNACSVQEALYHFFGLPVHVVAQPAGWYSCHRTPRIDESTADRTRVLVSFTAMSWSGYTFGGTCLYAKRDGQWGAYIIRPNQSDSIATAEAWLIKRKWEAWR